MVEQLENAEQEISSLQAELTSAINEIDRMKSMGSLKRQRIEDQENKAPVLGFKQIDNRKSSCIFEVSKTPARPSLPALESKTTPYFNFRNPF
jgi:hypothetical protein